MYNQSMLKADSLKGKTIVVTGGGTGLGRSMSQYFLTLGANVVITSRKLDVIEKTEIVLQWPAMCGYMNRLKICCKQQFLNSDK